MLNPEQKKDIFCCSTYSVVNFINLYQIMWFVGIFLICYIRLQILKSLLNTDKLLILLLEFFV